MRLVFIRHAEPDYTIDSLTEKGFNEAKFLGERAKAWKDDVDELYVSCLGRARRTAEPIEAALSKKAVVLDWLQEFHGIIDEKYGTHRGLPWDFEPAFWTKMPELYDKDAWVTSELMKPVEGKPSTAAVYKDTCEKLDELLAKHGYIRENGYYRVQEHSDETIVLVCHMAITFCMLGYLLGISFLPLMQGIFIPPTGVTVVNTEEIRPGIASFRCQGIGDVSHLHMNREPISKRGAFSEIFQK